MSSVTQKPALQKTPASLSGFQQTGTFSSKIGEIFTLHVKQWTNLEINVFTVKVTQHTFTKQRSISERTEFTTCGTTTRDNIFFPVA